MSYQDKRSPVCRKYLGNEAGATPRIGPIFKSEFCGRQAHARHGHVKPGNQSDGGYTLKTNRRRILRSFLYWGGGLAILLAMMTTGTPSSHAQLATTTATLSGTVTDPSGAVVSGATVMVSSTENGITRQLKTDSAGRYSFTQLPPSNYSLTVKPTGFETYKQNGIVLIAAETASQNVTLTVGAETQSITVTADATQLNVDNSNISANLDSHQIVNMPSNSRNVIGLLTLNSAVSNSSEGQALLGGGTNTTDDADQDFSFLNFNGGFFGTTAFMLDGSWDTDTEWFGVVFVPSIDAVQEMRVQSNSFTAQYGWSTGNVVNVTTKSGTSAFHGDAWDFYQNQDLNAVPRFGKGPNESLSREEVGERPAVHSISRRSMNRRRRRSSSEYSTI